MSSNAAAIVLFAVCFLAFIDEAIVPLLAWLRSRRERGLNGEILPPDGGSGDASGKRFAKRRDS